MTFERWLTEEASEAAGAPAQSTPAMGAQGKAEMRRRLLAILRRNEFYFRLSLTLAVLLAVCTAVTTFLAHSAGGTAWRPAMFGVSTFGAVVFVARIVRDKLAFEIMVEL